MSQIPFTPVTAEALERLTEEERAAFTEAAGQVAEGVEPSLAAVAELVAIVQRLITETAPAADGTGWAQDHAHRCLRAVHGPDYVFAAPETFSNMLERWVWAVGAGVPEMAETCMAAIEQHFAERGQPS